LRRSISAGGRRQQRANLGGYAEASRRGGCALDAGADIINDVTGLADPEMREVVADAGCPVVVMHSLDAPVDPTNDPEYDDVVDDVIAALRERLALAETAGIDREKVIVDPGLGFGKSATRRSI